MIASCTGSGSICAMGVKDKSILKADWIQNHVLHFALQKAFKGLIIDHTYLTLLHDHEVNCNHSSSDNDPSI